MENLEKKDKARIVDAIERAVKLANEGASPDDALFKVAQGEQLPPEMIRRVVEAFNTSKTLAHLKHASEDDKAASFDIASAENILGRLYPPEVETPEKAAMAGLHPDYETELGKNFAKAAAVKLPPLTDKKAELEMSPTAALAAATRERNQLGKLLKQAESEFRQTYVKIWDTVKAAAGYWRQAGKTEPFELVEKRAYATYGPPSKHVMDMIFEIGKLGDSRLGAKRAAAEELGTQQMYFDPEVEPYNHVADALLLAKVATHCRRAVHEIKKAMADHAFANINVFSSPVVEEAIDWTLKTARDMPSFTKQDRPKKVKDIYKALKREHPGMPAEMKARIAARQGKPGKQKQGPPYKGPLAKPKKSALDDLFDKEGGLLGMVGKPVEKAPVVPATTVPRTVVPPAVDEDEQAKNPLAKPKGPIPGAEGMGGKGTGGVAPAATPANQAAQ